MENPRAQRLYERLGYKVFGEDTIRWSYRDGERVIDVIEECSSMRKRLSASTGTG
jgi:RimJ/RimL family protein N-acetyltransferase